MSGNVSKRVEASLKQTVIEWKQMVTKRSCSNALKQEGWGVRKRVGINMNYNDIKRKRMRTKT